LLPKGRVRACPDGTRLSGHRGVDDGFSESPFFCRVTVTCAGGRALDVCGSVNGNHGCRPKDERTCSSDNRWGADAGGLAERCDVQIVRRRRIHRNIAVVASRRVASRRGRASTGSHRLFSSHAPPPPGRSGTTAATGGRGGRVAGEGTARGWDSEGTTDGRRGGRGRGGKFDGVINSRH